MDSATPSSHPLKTMKATVLTITIETQIIARKDSNIFPVAISRIINEKHMAVIKPVVAD